MTHLLDTDICSAQMLRPARLTHRLIQYISQVAISIVNQPQLYAGAYNSRRAHCAS